jgi:thiol-disulfide isomerase/thioredoxin
MRKLFATLLSLITLEGSQAQTISGTIARPTRGYIVFKCSNKYGICSKTDTVKLGKNGSFKYSVKFNTPSINGNIEIVPKHNIPIWLTDNTSLNLNIKDSSIVPNFSGELARINQYLQEENAYETRIYNSYKQNNPNFASYASSRSDEYFQITDSMTSDQLLFLKQSLQAPQNKYEQKFASQRTKDLIFKNLFYKISYDNPPLEKLIYYQKNFNVTSPTSFTYSDEINFNDPNLLSPYLLRFSRMFFMELVFKYQKSEKIKLSKESFYEKFFSEVDRLSKNKICNAVLKAAFIKDEVNFMSLTQNATVSTYSRFVDSLLSYSQISVEARFIEDMFHGKLNDIYARTSGGYASTCSLTDSVGNVVKLEDFKGKLVYIDVWATWCKPCIESIPHWNKLVEQYKNNKDVVFITVSTDETEDKGKWLQMLNKYKFKGLHFISTGGTESEFAKKFLVLSYPTNVLIDKEGRILQIKAERPETIDLSRYLQQ